MKRLKSGTLFFTNTFGSANEFGMILKAHRAHNVYLVILTSGKVGHLDRSYLLVGEEMEGLK